MGLMRLRLVRFVILLRDVSSIEGVSEKETNTIRSGERGRC